MRSSSRLAVRLLSLALCLIAFSSLLAIEPLQAQPQVQPQAKPSPTATLTRLQALRIKFYKSWIGDHPVTQSYTSAEASDKDFAQFLPQSGGIHWAHDCVFSVIQYHIDGNWELFTFRNLSQPDLNQPTDWYRVTYHPAADVHPRLNPQVTRIAFASNRDGNFEIYTVAVDGSDLRRLTYNDGNDSAPVWSPDGSKIAFVSDRDGNPELYVMNGDGSGQTRLTNNPAFDVEPTWSPDGRQLAWVRHTGRWGVIWAMQADGANAQPLTNELHFPQHLAWSPDGSKIAFDFDQDGDWFTELALIFASGGNPWGVGQTSWHMEERWCNGWSTDGTGIMFTRLSYLTYDEQFTVERTAYAGLTIMEIPGHPYLPSVTYLSPSLYGDTRRNDFDPPSSSVHRLPSYARAERCTVSWSGWDEVQKTVANYDLQYRIGDTGAWTDWLVGTEATSAEFAGPPGKTVYFRSRAKDRCQQLESWPSDSDAWTTLYAWELNGEVIDQRGVPLTNLPVSIQPAPVNPVHVGYQGRFTALTSAGGKHTIQTSASGYAATLPSSINMLADRAITLRLSPQDNLIANGDFEASRTDLVGWSAGGTLPVALTDGYTGDRAAVLGEDCAAPCLMEPEALWKTTDNWVNMVADEDGNIHMVWIGRADGNGRLYYARRSAAGVWEGPDVVSQGAIWWDRPALAIDNEGTLHLVWSYNWNEITYLQKPRGGDWSAPKSLGVGEQPSLAVDSAGRVHLIYFGMPASITYLNLDTEGNWSEERILGDSIGRSALVVGPDDTVHVLFMRVSETGQLEICHTMCRPGSKWTEPRAVCSNPSTSSESITMALGPDGKLHAFWIESGTGYYATRDLAGQWSKKQRIQQDLGSADMVVDGAGVVHLVCATNGGGALTYRWGSGDGVWSDPVSVRDHGKAASGRRPDLCLDRDNRLHLAWHSEIPIDGSTLRYTAMRCAAQTGTASLAQSVTIPADMHRPTLAFSYALRFAGAQAQHPLTIEVSDGVSTTQVSPEGGYVPMQWADAWIDMAPWAGQTVTVTFSLQQRADEPLARLALDDISLGSWLTPVITKVTPATVQDWTAGDTLLKIEGENLLPGAVVSLGERQLDTTWVDEHTLQASLPADLLPGIHPVRVTNPAGQSVEMAGVALGSQLELPAIYKWHVPR